MELKKSPIADLEDKRGTWFLLGLVFVLALLLVGFEYTSHDKSEKEAENVLDDVSNDAEMIPTMQQPGMVAATQGQGELAPSKFDKVDANLNVGHGKTTESLVFSPTEGGGADKLKDDEAAPPPPVAVDDNNNALNFRVVEELPDFPGGMVEFMKWLTRTLKYPVYAQQRKIQGKVMVSFIVNKDGSVADIKVLKSVNPYLDAEALRVMKMMPKWKPGQEKGKPCRTMIAIPVVFKL
jgi:protein TonB